MMADEEDRSTCTCTFGSASCIRRRLREGRRCRWLRSQRWSIRLWGVFEFGDGILGAAAEVENLLGIVGKDPARRGELDAGAKPVKQLAIQVLFELAAPGR